MDTRPIGIFDSGLGGLTALRALRKELPHENIVYFADTARMPYGARPAEELRRMARQDLDFVASKGVKCILAACGTVSSTAPDVLEGYEIRSFNVISATVREAARRVGIENIRTAKLAKLDAEEREMEADYARERQVLPEFRCMLLARLVS